MPGHLILIFAYYFPPQNAIGAARPFRFYKYLKRLGYRCHVITAADVSGRPDLDAEAVPDPFVVRPRQGIGWQLERAVRKLLVPGATGTHWALHAFRAARRVILEQQPERVTIFSTFPPLGSHLAAFLLARKERIAWIADYRDPLSDNPIYDDWGVFWRTVSRTLERAFVNSPALVIANTDAARDKLVAAYPRKADHIELIWNGFDPEERLRPAPKVDTSRYVLSHVGDLYGGRDVRPILYSIKRLIENGCLHPDFIGVRLIGPAEASSIPDQVFMGAAAREGWLDFQPVRLPLSEAQQIVCCSDGLLLVQPQSILQVPGKLFEYLQIGRPILAYVPPNSPVERILQKSGVLYECIYPDSTAEQMDAKLSRFFKMRSVHAEPNAWFEKEFSAEHQSRRLADLIEKIHYDMSRNESRRSAA
ncbi:MAG: glycosyltransferase [Acidobacteriaceae bacterium]|nr:glycosyltransferase [Acidobacteriaceae bacterium]MBV8573191.1 glycosyltransferase [Acidobacteriaceae bacterium]